MKTFKNWLVVEATTWADIFRKKPENKKNFGVLQDSDDLEPFAPVLNGWKARFEPTGYEFDVIRVDEKFVIVSEDGRENRVPLGDGFVWGDWVLVNPEGKTVSLKQS